MFKIDILKKILLLTDEGLSILIEKINDSTINYKKTHILKFVLSVFRRIVLYKSFMSHKSDDSVATLLCLENIHYKDDKLKRNVKRLFEIEKDVRIFNLDSEPVLTIKERLKICMYTVITVCIYILLQKDKRDILTKVIRQKVKAWISYQGILNINPKKVILIGMSYNLRRFFLSYWLTNNQYIKSVYYINRPFISKKDNMICDELILSNKWAYEVFNSINVKIICNKISFLHNINYAEIPKISAKNINIRKKRIAFYMSGAYMRKELGFTIISFIQRELEREISVINLLKHYAISYTQLDFVIFPHPSVETEDSARYHYQYLLKLENIHIRTEGKKSAELYDEYELGISSGSNTIFERIEAGHKGLFVYPIPSLEVYKKSSLGHIILDGIHVTPKNIEYFRNLEHNTFFDLIG